MSLISCKNDSITDDLIINGVNIYAAGYYIEGYPNGIQYATYWLNGDRFILGEGEITDIHVKDGTVYATGTDESWQAVYWVDGVKTVLPGNETSAHSIFVQNDDVYVAGSFSNGSCYWKNGSKINLTTNADSEAFGIVVTDDGKVVTGGYYMNNHHSLIPARWNGTSRKNMSKPHGGDAEIYDVKLKNNTAVFFGMTMRSNNMVGLLPKASYWINGKRTDCNNGGTWQQNIYGGEGISGYTDGNDIYVTGNIQHIGTVDPDGNPKTEDYPHIINNSWGFPVSAPLSQSFFDRALARWRELGIIPVFAAGNEGDQGPNTISYPANSFQVLTIGATRRDQRAPFSSMGSNLLRKPDFMAPGYRLFSLKKGLNGPVYGRMSGTSMSAPLVSGLVAIMKQIDPFIGFSEVYRVLQSSTEDMDNVGWDPETGWGRINFLNAVKASKVYLSDKISHGGKDTFKYFGHFSRKFEVTRDAYYRKQMISLELSYMNFLQRQFESKTNIVGYPLTRYFIFCSGPSPFSASIFSEIISINLDKEGRFLIPEELKNYANIKTEAAFFGQGHFFQIWETNNGLRNIEKSRTRLLKEKKSLRMILVDKK